MQVQTYRRVEHYRSRSCLEYECLSSTCLQLSWPQKLLRKWLNLRISGDEFSADEEDDTQSDQAEFVSCHTFTEDSILEEEYISNMKQLCIPEERPPKFSSGRLRRGCSDTLLLQQNGTKIRIHVGTWNVAGKPPPTDLDLRHWLNTEDAADLYILGFQEIVPLNAGNVLGAEDDGPAARWEALIRITLNNRSSQYEKKSHTVPSSPGRHGVQDASIPFDSKKLGTEKGLPSDADYWLPRVGSLDHKSEDSAANEEENLVTWLLSPKFRQSSGEFSASQRNGKFVRIVSKQMVGLFMTVWIRQDLRYAIANLKVSCVGCGLMGYLGNKGSISVSMLLHQTNFCFVCAHLTSGEREGDELRRNADIAEIMRRTQFSRSSKYGGSSFPGTILAHDQIIWLGDLNYRLALSHSETQLLIAKEDWDSLLQNDQLKLEQNAGRVLEGWQEGSIEFPPTYKYIINSDCYLGGTSKPGEKRRTPAWCDRILWFGEGLKQISYVRADSQFSDHRPVYAAFLSEVKVHPGNQNFIKFLNQRAVIDQRL